MKKILVVHSNLYAWGGAEMVCAHVLEISQRLGHVTLVHCGGPLDVGRVREISGCALDPARVRFVTPGWGGRLPRWRGRFALWAHAAAVRYARRIAPEYDLVISTMGECPINAPHCLQILHFPIYSIREEHLKFLGISIRNRLHYLARVAYTLIGRAICGWNRGALRRARTIVNSDWTGRIVRELYGVTRVTRIWPKSNVLATPDSPQWVPFNAREDAFVMLGRIHPSKRIEQGIKVIERLRARQHEVKLHVVGIVSDEGYFERLRRRVEGKDFVTYHLGLSRADLEGLVLRCRYGLHAHEHEHFGIAAAEMQRLGCIVFVPDGGGQREVVRPREQRYESVDEAVERIEAVMTSPQAQERLRAAAEPANAELGASAFDDAFLRILREELGMAASSPKPTSPVTA